MKYKISGIMLFCFVFALVAFFVQGVSAVTVYSGDTVELSGGALGSDYVYLFIYGPNLHSNGVSLEDISSAVETGFPSSFTRVSTGNNVWKYKWDTNTAGGTPDTGNYAVYAVNSPSGRNDLAGEEYALIQVTIKDPSVSVQSEIKTVQTQTAMATTAAINPEIADTESSEKKIYTVASTPAAIEPSQTATTQAAGFLAIPFIAVLTSMVLILGIKKR